MKVTLVDFTGSGHADPSDYAAGVLLFTKNTRLQMSPGALQAAMDMPMKEKLKELAYMANSIPSSWEFVSYTFLIEGVTRAFTHQLVRTRTASFAQQTMRVLDVKGWDYATGPTLQDSASYRHIMSLIAGAYSQLIADGAAIEDARGVLPTNILTNIVMKIDLRNFVSMVRKRSSPRVQGEYRAVLQSLQDCTMAVHPWIKLFIDSDADHATKALQAEIAELADTAQAARMIKQLDIIRSQ